MMGAAGRRRLAIPACLIPKILSDCLVSIQDPKPAEIRCRSRETVRPASSFVKQTFLKALLPVSAMLCSQWCHSEPGGRVTLAIAGTDTNAIISWPFPSRGFGLEFATNPVTTNWQPATATSVSNDGRWEVTAPASEPGGFFRLKNHLQYFGFWAGDRKSV